MLYFKTFDYACEYACKLSIAASTHSVTIGQHYITGEYYAVLDDLENPTGGNIGSMDSIIESYVNGECQHIYC